MIARTLERVGIPLVPLSVGLVVVTVLALTPLVGSRFPDYMAGHLVQVVAILVGYVYFASQRLFDHYRGWPERVLLILAFAIPLQNTFAIKAARKAFLSEHILLEILRPDILALCSVGVYLFFSLRPIRVQSMTLVAAAILAVLGWIFATATAHHSFFLSLGHGFFETMIFWIAFVVLCAVAPDRAFYRHCGVLFCLGFALVAGAQSYVIIERLPDYLVETLVFPIPVFASEFLEAKKSIELMKAAGGNGYGNTDNFASLWALVAVAAAGGAYFVRPRWAVWAMFAFIAYAGLLVYPRSALATVLIGLAGLWVYRAWIHRSYSVGLIIAIAAITVSHSDPEAARYLLDGALSLLHKVVAALSSGSESGGAGGGGGGFFFEWLDKRLKSPGGGDLSGFARADAWAAAIAVIKEHWAAGVGFGVYRSIVPEYTATHSFLLQRWAEGGVLSFLSVLILTLYAFIASFVLLVRREADMMRATAIIAASAFLLKASLFGASLAVMGLTPWAFGLALCFASYQKLR
ncbi:hypothetical protein [Nitratireductor sp. StC3]|uniref:hypothetical protein n=1 Tax=Nitratireductor sp. StC3 TaxID=2126741 RepID=UPI000D0DF595|nr:hypothetical protein [Nitratireductor sp. StC3]PSM18208.1 hypothetical protein C7T96_10075 [Nitratireductor sp. StC3]